MDERIPVLQTNLSEIITFLETSTTSSTVKPRAVDITTIENLQIQLSNLTFIDPSDNTDNLIDIFNIILDIITFFSSETTIVTFINNTTINDFFTEQTTKFLKNRAEYSNSILLEITGHDSEFRVINFNDSASYLENQIMFNNQFANTDIGGVSIGIVPVQNTGNMNINFTVPIYSYKIFDTYSVVYYLNIKLSKTTDIQPLGTNTLTSFDYKTNLSNLLINCIINYSYIDIFNITVSSTDITADMKAYIENITSSSETERFLYPYSLSRSKTKREDFYKKRNFQARFIDTLTLNATNTIENTINFEFDIVNSYAPFFTITLEIKDTSITSLINYIINSISVVVTLSSDDNNSITSSIENNIFLNDIVKSDPENFINYDENRNVLLINIRVMNTAPFTITKGHILLKEIVSYSIVSQESIVNARVVDTSSETFVFASLVLDSNCIPNFLTNNNISVSNVFFQSQVKSSLYTDVLQNNVQEVTETEIKNINSDILKKTIENVLKETKKETLTWKLTNTVLPFHVYSKHCPLLSYKKNYIFELNDICALYRNRVGEIYWIRNFGIVDVLLFQKDTNNNINYLYDENTSDYDVLQLNGTRDNATIMTLIPVLSEKDKMVFRIKNKNIEGRFLKFIDDPSNLPVNENPYLIDNSDLGFSTNTGMTGTEDIEFYTDEQFVLVPNNNGSFTFCHWSSERKFGPFYLEVQNKTTHPKFYLDTTTFQYTLLGYDEETIWSSSQVNNINTDITIVSDVLKRIQSFTRSDLRQSTKLIPIQTSNGETKHYLDNKDYIFIDDIVDYKGFYIQNGNYIFLIAKDLTSGHLILMNTKTGNIYFHVKQSHNGSTIGFGLEYNNQMVFRINGERVWNTNDGLEFLDTTFLYFGLSDSGSLSLQVNNSGNFLFYQNNYNSYTNIIQEDLYTSSTFEKSGNAIVHEQNGNNYSVEFLNKKNNNSGSYFTKLKLPPIFTIEFQYKRISNIGNEFVIHWLFDTEPSISSVETYDGVAIVFSDKEKKIYLRYQNQNIKSFSWNSSVIDEYTHVKIHFSVDTIDTSKINIILFLNDLEFFTEPIYGIVDTFEKRKQYIRWTSWTNNTTTTYSLTKIQILRQQEETSTQILPTYLEKLSQIQDLRENGVIYGNTLGIDTSIGKKLNIRLSDDIQNDRGIYYYENITSCTFCLEFDFSVFKLNNPGDFISIGWFCKKEFVSRVGFQENHGGFQIYFNEVGKFISLQFQGVERLRYNYYQPTTSWRHVKLFYYKGIIRCFLDNDEVINYKFPYNIIAGKEYSVLKWIGKTGVLSSEHWLKNISFYTIQNRGISDQYQLQKQYLFVNNFKDGLTFGSSQETSQAQNRLVSLGLSNQIGYYVLQQQDFSSSFQLHFQYINNTQIGQFLSVCWLDNNLETLSSSGYCIKLDETNNLIQFMYQNTVLFEKNFSFLFVSNFKRQVCIDFVYISTIHHKVSLFVDNQFIFSVNNVIESEIDIISQNNIKWIGQGKNNNFYELSHVEIFQQLTSSLSTQFIQKELTYQNFFQTFHTKHTQYVGNIISNTRNYLELTNETNLFSGYLFIENKITFFDSFSLQLQYQNTNLNEMTVSLFNTFTTTSVDGLFQLKFLDKTRTIQWIVNNSILYKFQYDDIIQDTNSWQQVCIEYKYISSNEQKISLTVNNVLLILETFTIQPTSTFLQENRHIFIRSLRGEEPGNSKIRHVQIYQNDLLSTSTTTTISDLNTEYFGNTFKDAFVDWKNNLYYSSLKNGVYYLQKSIGNSFEMSFDVNDFLPNSNLNIVLFANLSCSEKLEPDLQHSEKHGIYVLRMVRIENSLLYFLDKGDSYGNRIYKYLVDEENVNTNVIHYINSEQRPLILTNTENYTKLDIVQNSSTNGVLIFQNILPFTNFSFTYQLRSSSLKNSHSISLFSESTSSIINNGYSFQFNTNNIQFYIQNSLVTTTNYTVFDKEWIVVRVSILQGSENDTVQLFVNQCLVQSHVISEPITKINSNVKLVVLNSNLVDNIFSVSRIQLFEDIKFFPILTSDTIGDTNIFHIKYQTSSLRSTLELKINDNIVFQEFLPILEQNFYYSNPYLKFFGNGNENPSLLQNIQILNKEESIYENKNPNGIKNIGIYIDTSRKEATYLYHSQDIENINGDNYEIISSPFAVNITSPSFWFTNIIIVHPLYFSFFHPLVNSSISLFSDKIIISIVNENKINVLENQSIVFSTDLPSIQETIDGMYLFEISFVENTLTLSIQTIFCFEHSVQTQIIKSENTLFKISPENSISVRNIRFQQNSLFLKNVDDITLQEVNSLISTNFESLSFSQEFFTPKEDVLSIGDILVSTSTSFLEGKILNDYNSITLWNSSNYITDVDYNYVFFIEYNKILIYDLRLNMIVVEETFVNTSNQNVLLWVDFYKIYITVDTEDGTKLWIKNSCSDVCIDNFKKEISFLNESLVLKNNTLYSFLQENYKFTTDLIELNIFDTSDTQLLLISAFINNFDISNKSICETFFKENLEKVKVLTEIIKVDVSFSLIENIVKRINFDTNKSIPIENIILEINSQYQLTTNKCSFNNLSISIVISNFTNVITSLLTLFSENKTKNSFWIYEPFFSILSSILQFQNSFTDLKCHITSTNTLKLQKFFIFVLSLLFYMLEFLFFFIYSIQVSMDETILYTKIQKYKSNFFLTIRSNLVLSTFVENVFSASVSIPDTIQDTIHILKVSQQLTTLRLHYELNLLELEQYTITDSILLNVYKTILKIGLLQSEHMILQKSNINKSIHTITHFMENIFKDLDNPTTIILLEIKNVYQNKNSLQRRIDELLLSQEKFLLSKVLNKERKENFIKNSKTYKVQKEKTFSECTNRIKKDMMFLFPNVDMEVYDNMVYKLSFEMNKITNL